MLLDGGGASPYIHGFSLPQGPGDSPDLLLEDTCRSGRSQNDPALAEKLAGGSLTVPDLLRRLGVSLDREADGSLSLLHPLGASVPRVASAGNHTGAVLMGRLRERLAARGNVHFCGGYRALRLFTDSAGVTGSGMRWILWNLPLFYQYGGYRRRRNRYGIPGGSRCTGSGIYSV